ncbi:tetratricopeptide repeat-containing protein [Fusarium globosum]|uniref:Tetratricopeptide repeat-containing protein n=1 Tax=Fusarium globosum TaxID=78864 RepID=A0A8H5XFC2_9HYPO|nr:tetratricopeptide repeat-containing protein [Fusarium globosum]
MQPSDYIERRTKEILSMASYDASAANWKSYTRSLEAGLEHLEEKTMFSQADYYESNDYVLRFSDRQKLQELQHKIQKASRVLSSAAHTANMFHEFCNNRQFIKSNGPRKIITQEIESHQAEIVHYQSVVQGLLQRAAQTGDLLTSILQYRASISTLSSTHANNKSLASLIHIGRQGEEDGKIVQKTSINTAALTFVATLYLPATLLSVSMSTTEKY